MEAIEITRGIKRKWEDMPKEKEVIKSDYPGQEIRIGVELPLDIREMLIDMLKKYKHVFAWIPLDMVGIDRKLIEHRLNIQPSVSIIKQKKHDQAGERNRETNLEVSKLVDANILQDAFFHVWITNPVMVKKSDGT